MDWKNAVDNNTAPPQGPLPPSFQTFLLLAKLSNYGFNITLAELENMDARLLLEWLIIMQVVKPEDINVNLSVSLVNKAFGV